MTDTNVNGGNAGEQVTNDYVETTNEPAVDVGTKVTPQPEEEDQPQEQKQQPKKKGGYQRRIENQQREIEYWKQQAAKTAQPPQADTNAAKKTTNGGYQLGEGEPNPDDYDDVLAYLKDHNKWAGQEAVKNYKAEQQTAAQEAEYEEKQATFNDRADALLEHVPDFYERAAALYQQGLVSEQLEAAILDSDMGEMVSLYFMANPHELQELQGATEGKVFRAVALVEAKLKAGALSNGQQRAMPQHNMKRTTQATAPISPIKAAAKTQVSITDDDLSYEDFKAMRERR